jgi:hypothetical protein
MAIQRGVHAVGMQGSSVPLPLLAPSSVVARSPLDLFSVTLTWLFHLVIRVNTISYRLRDEYCSNAVIDPLSADDTPKAVKKLWMFSWLSDAKLVDELKSSQVLSAEQQKLAASVFSCVTNMMTTATDFVASSFHEQSTLSVESAFDARKYLTSRRLGQDLALLPLPPAHFEITPLASLSS